MTSAYHVAWQIFSTIYMEPTRQLSGPDLGRLWAATCVFGNHNAYGNFWHQDCIPSAANSRTTKLGAMGILNTLLARDTRSIFGGVSCGQATGKTVDTDFHFAHCSAGRCFGYDTLPLFMMGVSGEWLEKIGSASYLDQIKAQFEVIDKYCPPYGMVDIGSSEDCYSGFVYTSFFSGNARLHRWIEHIKFLNGCTRRRDQARGIFWGNYFGPAILQRLGGRATFVSRYRQQAKDGNGEPSGLIWEFTNGVFVSLCLDPLGCKPGPPLDGAAGHNLHWLVVELGSRGVLCPWSGE